MNLAEKIVTVIERHAPVKGAEIPVLLVREFGEDVYHEWARHDVDHATAADLADRESPFLTVNILEDLVESGRIIEVEYVMRDDWAEDGPIVHRAKSLFFPPTTEVRVRGV